MQGVRGANAQQGANAQDKSSCMWLLSELKHAPLHETVSAVLRQFVALCKASCLQPTAQSISNVLGACAEFRLDMHQGQVQITLKRLLGLPISRVAHQHYSNVTWSLAVMGLLGRSIFDSLLAKLTAKHDQSQGEPGTPGTFDQLVVSDVKQLHQALESLGPLQNSELMEAWCVSHSGLQAVAPAPHLGPSLGKLSYMMRFKHRAWHTRLGCFVGFTRQMLYHILMTRMLPQSS